MEEAKNQGSIVRFLMIIIIINISILKANIERGGGTSFEKVLKYYPLLSNVVDPFPPEEKTLSLKSSHKLWNGHFLDATKRLRKIKKDEESGFINGTVVMYHRYEKNDIQIPAVMTIDWYKNRAIEENMYNELKKSVIKKIKNKNKNTTMGGKDLTLFNKKVGNTDLELSINGYITFKGNLVFETKDLVTTNSKDSKSWDLEIEQTQRFNIMGNIGDRFFTDIKQDSEADFNWENDMKIEYRGKKNEILQKAEAGNINLSLSGMDAVNMGGNNSSLFGIKAVNQFGPIEIQSVIAREQVKKSEKSFSGGMDDGAPISLKDYDFIIDRYFFIDESFRNNFYPLVNNVHQINTEYVIGDYELYQMVTTDYEGDPIYATAYINPSSSEDTNESVEGSWKRMEENTDYKINRLYGYIRLNNAQNAIAIAYTTTNYENQNFGTQQDSTNTNFKSSYDICKQNYPDSWQENCKEEIKLKLIKGINRSTPIDPTWPLMFKNVYSLGGYDIDKDELEVNIVQNQGAGLEETHDNTTGESYLSIFNLDSENQNHMSVDGGDGKIDLYDSILNYEYGELIFPMHMPFAYDSFNPPQWGNPNESLEGVLVQLDDEDANFELDVDSGPAMYYTTTTDHIIDEHEFLIKIKTSTKSSTMNLDGFMIVEGSETVRLGSQVLQKDIDYTIDYFSGVINFINQDALDPAAEIKVSYEENQFISFDQKLLMGTYMKYGFGEKNYLAGGLFYYNQSIAEEKVDIGYEPMQNIAWNITGKYQNELAFITRAVDILPFIKTTKQSKLSLEASYAEIIPNPNPLGQAFIDDFESSKRTSSLSILQRQWKMSSPPNDETQFFIQTNKNRSKISWYNPYTDVLTESIWPEQSTSHQADNNTTKILEIETEFNGIAGEQLWNGIMTPLYASEYNQSESKYLDIWLNANDIKDEDLELYIDIGHISEDWNDNLELNTEDEDVYGPGMGDNILSNGEDVGVDNCTDIYEDGWGGCLCTEYSENIYDYTLSEIEIDVTQFCDTQDSTYVELLDADSDRVNHMVLDITDPNGDDWCYNTVECGTDNYSKINGTEGNGQALGHHYPDTEDMNKNKTLDDRNDYFTILIKPKSINNSMVITETINNSLKTGWKLFRIPLTDFSSIGSPAWSDVQTFRIRIQSDYTGIEQQIIKVAKIELVRNEWKEWGLTSDYNINTVDDNVEYFSVEVINTDESTEYKESIQNSNLNIIQEHDEYNNIDMKEQSLVLSYLQDTANVSGIGVDSIALVKNSYPALTSEKSLSYFAYEKMQMYIHGGDPECDNCNWFNTQTSDVEFLFRFGKDGNDNYYEIRQPIYKGWDNRNHIDVNIAKLTEMKIPTLDVQFEYDVGLDGCIDEKETGSQDINIGPCLDEPNDSTFNYYCNCFSLQSCDGIAPEDFINVLDCDIISDPNQDNYHIIDNPDGTENNNSLDSSDEQAFEDYNGDGIYTVYANYDNFNDIYIWDIEGANSNDIEEACNYCSELRIKGSPSINNIQNIVMGIVNTSDERIYGKVLVNELRMSGVKKNKERSYSIAGSLDFADLMTISGNYQHKDAGFHKLQQRLGTGNSDDKYSTTIKLHPNILFPVQWGVKTPITISYTNEVHTPKYDPGTDILTENIINIEELQTRGEKYSLYTSFSKSARSPNWFIKRTIDNISFTYSAIKNKKSDSQILQEFSWDFKVTGNYNYNWGKENYISPFKFTKDWLLIGNILGDTRHYYTPDKLITKIEFNENNKTKIQRTSGTETETYSFKMNRQLILTHKFTKTFTTKYDLQINSNLDQFKDNKWAIVKSMNIGRIDGITEKFTNTFKPEFMSWLNPEVTFNPTYSWGLNILSDTLTADIKSSATFRTKVGLNLQDFIELIYTPDNKNKSTGRGRGRGRGNKNYKNNNKINIQNPIARVILGKLHSLTSIVRTISSTYTYSTSHNYDNVSTDLYPSYLYRLGMQKSPLYNSDLFYDDFYSTTSNSIIPSGGHSYNTDFKISTNINVIKSINTGVEFKNSHSLTESSTSSTNENMSMTFFPLGSRGDKGFPITNWSINWSKIEKFWFLNNIFKTISINHGFNGEKSMTYSNAELQNEQYSIHYSPVIGFTGITKGLNPITINANYNLNQTIKNIDEYTERNHNNQFTASVKYKKTGGMKLNTFFFRDFYIKNNMDFSLTFNYNIDKALITPTRVDNIADFNEQSKNNSWSVSPNIGYSFTRWVTGNIYMVYGITENSSTGRTEEKDFGFNMNIKIAG